MILRKLTCGEAPSVTHQNKLFSETKLGQADNIIRTSARNQTDIGSTNLGSIKKKKSEHKNSLFNVLVKFKI